MKRQCEVVGKWGGIAYDAFLKEFEREPLPSG